MPDFFLMESMLFDLECVDFLLMGDRGSAVSNSDTKTSLVASKVSSSHLPWRLVLREVVGSLSPQAV